MTLHPARTPGESWWRRHYGAPCRIQRATVYVGRAAIHVDARTAPVWEAFERVRARHGYDVHVDFPRTDPVTGEQGDTGGYNCRHIGNDPDRPWSVHAWGGAVDFNWRANPDGSRLVTDMPRAMIDDLEALHTVDGHPVLRWGGDWDRDPRTGHSYYDAMHWEVIATPGEIATGIVDPNDTEDDMSAEQYDDLVARIERLRAEVGAVRSAGDRRHAERSEVLAAIRDSISDLGSQVAKREYAVRDTIAALFRRMLGVPVVGDNDEQQRLDRATGARFQHLLGNGADDDQST